MKLYSLAIVILALSTSLTSAQGSPTDLSSPLIDQAPPPPPMSHSHKCPAVPRITCSSTQCTANNEGVIWKSDLLDVHLNPPYFPEGVVSKKSSVAPGGGNIVLSVTGCQYHDSSKNKTKLILNVPNKPPNNYLPCTGIQGKFEMDCTN